MRPRLLIIDDDPGIHQSLKPLAEELGFELESAFDGEQGLRRVSSGEISFLILDLKLPKLGGMEVCRKLRSSNEQIPIIMLTACADELNTVLSLELGADDYVAKPFRLPELAARIKSLLRRIQVSQEAGLEGMPLQVVGEIAVDLRRRLATRRGERVELSRLEFDLLAFLIRSPGVPQTRQTLIQEVWGYQCSNFEETVTTYLRRLRQKIEDDPASPRYVLTVRGVGYAFAHPDELKP